MYCMKGKGIYDQRERERERERERDSEGDRERDGDGKKGVERRENMQSFPKW